MEIPEARYAAAVLLAGKMSLTLDRTMFLNRLPPGVTEGVSLRFSAIRSWSPAGAKECDAVVTGVFADESTLFARLAPLREMLYFRGESGILAWSLRDPVKLEFLPGGPADRYGFTANLTIAFV